MLLDCLLDNIIKNVLTDQNYIDTNKDVFIEETSGIRKIVVPNVNPYNLITNLATEIGFFMFCKKLTEPQSLL